MYQIITLCSLSYNFVNYTSIKVKNKLQLRFMIKFNQKKKNFKETTITTTTPTPPSLHRPLFFILFAFPTQTLCHKAMVVSNISLLEWSRNTHILCQPQKWFYPWPLLSIQDSAQIALAQRGLPQPLLLKQYFPHFAVLIMILFNPMKAIRGQGPRGL